MKDWKDGLPDVGKRCEVWAHSDAWIEGLSVYHDIIDGDVKVAVVKIHHDTYMPFSAKCIRPIKKREPKTGEVWLYEEAPCLYTSDHGIYNLVTSEVALPSQADTKRAEYLAPSVKAYIAREIVSFCEEEYDPAEAMDYRHTIRYAARLDDK